MSGFSMAFQEVSVPMLSLLWWAAQHLWMEHRVDVGRRWLMCTSAWRFGQRFMRTPGTRSKQISLRWPHWIWAAWDIMGLQQCTSPLQCSSGLMRQTASIWIFSGTTMPPGKVHGSTLPVLAISMFQDCFHARTQYWCRAKWCVSMLKSLMIGLGWWLTVVKSLANVSTIISGLPQLAELILELAWHGWQLARDGGCRRCWSKQLPTIFHWQQLLQVAWRTGSKCQRTLICFCIGGCWIQPFWGWSESGPTSMTWCTVRSKSVDWKQSGIEAHIKCSIQHTGEWERGMEMCTY